MARKATIWSALGLLALAIIIVVAGLPVYVYPHTDPPRKTDVVFVIGPPTASRVALARSILDKGLSSNLMISVPAKGMYSKAELPGCYEQTTYYTTYCHTPTPFTTQGEARYLREMARKHGWTSATIITFTPHVTRARVIMQRCFSGTLTMVADRSPLPAGEWIEQYLYQTGAFIKVGLSSGC